MDSYGTQNRIMSTGSHWLRAEMIPTNALCQRILKSGRAGVEEAGRPLRYDVSIVGAKERGLVATTLVSTTNLSIVPYQTWGRKSENLT